MYSTTPIDVHIAELSTVRIKKGEVKASPYSVLNLAIYPFVGLFTDMNQYVI